MIKRLFDIVVSFSALLLLSPLFALVAIIIKLDSAGSVFFRQKRVGQFGVPFEIHKFRTMTSDAGAKGWQLATEGDVRITRSGRFLRKYKLDELPQLIDVLQGTMSLVGPRPEVPMYMALYPDAARKIVLSVRPGITDVASIEFKDENNILTASIDPERAYIDIILPRKICIYQKYVAECSFWSDFVLILKTLLAIVWHTPRQK